MDALQLQLLSAATNPAGSACSSPAFFVSSALSSGSIINALAPKKLLKKRKSPRAHTVINSRTIFPSTAPKAKVDYSHFPVLFPRARGTHSDQALQLPKKRMPRSRTICPPFPIARRTSTATPSTAAGCPRRSVHTKLFIKFSKKINFFLVKSGRHFTEQKMPDYEPLPGYTGESLQQ